MKPLLELASSTDSKGSHYQLFLRDDAHYLQINGQTIESSRIDLPYTTLARLASSPFRPAKQPKVLIDGLGLGHFLRACTECLSQAGALFTVAEPASFLKDWHESHLQELYPGLLNDDRISIKNASANQLASHEAGSLQLILSSSPDTPSSCASRDSLFSNEGIRNCHSALKNGGLFAVASPKHDSAFIKKLEKAGFQVIEELCPPSEKSKSRRLYSLLLARKGHYQSQNRSFRSRS